MCYSSLRLRVRLFLWAFSLRLSRAFPTVLDAGHRGQQTARTDVKEIVILHKCSSSFFFPSPPLPQRLMDVDIDHLLH